MSGELQVHRSHRLEALVDALGRAIAEPLASPFTPETIVVPSSAMGKWLALRLAEREGIWANPRFVTMDGFVADLAGPTPEPDPFSVASLSWAVAAALPPLLADPRFASVQGYLDGDADATKRVSLSERIAATFARYLAHRPEMILAWERGEADDRTAAWQPPLWRALVDRCGSQHRASRHVAVPTRARVASLERVCVFAPERMSEEARSTLAAIADVHVFVRDARGHVLFESLGERARQLDAVLPASTNDAPPVALPKTSVHSCHSAMRECEVLRDQLLARFEVDAALEARDVLVLCPDIESYAPVIDAVFGIPPNATGYLPYRIADRPPGRALRVIESFLSLLDLAPSRLRAPEVLDFLAREAVRERFGLDEAAIDVVRRWVGESGIRWAEDEVHRSELRQPEYRENTWRFGLDRLLVGYAMGSTDNALFEGVLPYDDVEGRTSETLGGLSRFCEELFATRRRLGADEALSLAEWRDRLVDALARMLATSWQTEFQHQLLRDALDAIVARAAAVGFVEAVPLSVVRDALRGEVAERTRGFESSVGGITFASLTSARCVPSRIVGLLGMNDGVFPRVPQHDGFDLIAKAPRAGDPSARDDDRQGFLDALLSARQAVIVTYVGQSIENNKQRPPSVVVSELLDVTGTSVVRHPLHAFSPVYFDGQTPQLFSHAAGLCDGAKSMQGPRVDLARFCCAPLALPADVSRTITIDALARFFEHPVRTFMQTRLGVSLGWDIALLEDREPLEMNALDRWIFSTPLLERARRDGGLPPSVPSDLVAQGKLPLGVVGVTKYEELLPGILDIAEKVREHMGPAEPGRMSFQYPVGDALGTQLTGWFRNVTPQAHVLYTYSKHSGRRLIGAWVRHLALQCAGVRRPTVMVCQAQATKFRPVAKPDAVLGALVDLYWRGLEGPLLLFADAGHRYADALDEGSESAMAAARKTFMEMHGSSSDGYVRRAFGTVDNGEPLALDFEPFCELRNAQQRVRYPSFPELAEAVFGPLLEHSEVV